MHLANSRELLSVFTEKVEVERVGVTDIALGPIRAETLEIVVKDLTYASEAAEKTIDGMVGLDLIGHSPFTIDLVSKRIVFDSIDPSLPSIPFKTNPGYLTVEMKIEGQNLSLLVDSGASDLVLFEDTVHGLASAITNKSSQTWSNMGGQIKVEQVQLRDAYLGSVPWGSLLLGGTSGNIPAGLNGLMGLASLNPRLVGFDPIRKVLALQQLSVNPPPSFRLGRKHAPGATSSLRAKDQL